MKKFIAMLLAVAAACMCFSFVGCGGDAPDGNNGNGGSIGSGETGENEGDENADETGDTGNNNTPLSYSVKWYDEDGTLLKTSSVKEGDVPSYSYEKQDTNEWEYTFIGWATEKNGTKLNSIPAASSNASYYALIDSVKKQYTISFDSNGGSNVAAQTADYGSQVQKPDDPTNGSSLFLGWFTAAQGGSEVSFPVTVTCNDKYYAHWQEDVGMKALLNTLLSDYELDPYSFIPEAMLPTYKSNQVNAGNIKTQRSNYSSFVNKQICRRAVSASSGI